MIGFTLRGFGPGGESVRYPAPDDVLRDTSLIGWPVVLELEAAIAEARGACIEAQGWEVALVYEVAEDDTETLVACVGQRERIETPRGDVLVWVEVAGGPRLGYGTIAEAIQALEDEARETRIIAELEAERIAELGR